MATDILISPEEYLRTSFDGVDREYVDGRIVDRGMPPYIHGRTQMRLGFLFELLAARHPVFPASEVRHAINSKNFRIPDLVVFADREPAQAVPDSPPLVAVEIVSPDDRLSELLTKLGEYQAWGIANIWLIDPQTKKLFIYDAGGLHPVDTFSLPQYDFSITLTDLKLY